MTPKQIQKCLQAVGGRKQLDHDIRAYKLLFHTFKTPEELAKVGHGHPPPPAWWQPQQKHNTETKQKRKKQTKKRNKITKPPPTLPSSL